MCSVESVRAECTPVDDSTVKCDVATLTELRNADRAIDAVCTLIRPNLASLPPRVEVLCDDHAVTAKWVVQARNYENMKQRALDCEAKRNQCEGAKRQARGDQKHLEMRVIDLEKKVTTWKLIAGSTGALVVGAGLLLVFEATGVTSIDPSGR